MKPIAIVCISLIFLLQGSQAIQINQQRAQPNTQFSNKHVVSIEKDITDFVTLLHVPTKPKENQKVTARFQCSRPLIVLFYVDGYHYDFQPDVDKLKDPTIFFRDFWNCTRSAALFEREIKIDYPPQILLAPSPLTPKVWNIRNATIKVAMTSLQDFNYVMAMENKQRDPFTMLYEKARQTLSTPLEIPDPYCRPKTYGDKCYTWEFDLMDSLYQNFNPMSYHDDTSINLATHPMAFSTDGSGLFLTLRPFVNPEFRSSKLTEPEFIISTTMFIASKCHKRLCGIFTHIDENEDYASPNLFIKEDNRLLLQMKLIDDQSYAFTSLYTVPLKEWVKIVWEQRGPLSNITLYTGENHTDAHPFLSRFHLPLKLNYTNGFMTLGGNLHTASFNGFIGEATLLRNTGNNADRILKHMPNHFMYKIGFEQFLEKADALKEAILQKRDRVFENKLFSGLQQDTCAQPFAKQLLHFCGKDICSIKPTMSLPKKYRTAETLISSKLPNSLTNEQYIEKFAEKCYKKSMAYLVSSEYIIKDSLKTANSVHYDWQSFILSLLHQMSAIHPYCTRLCKNMKKSKTLVNLLEFAAKLGHRHANYLLHAMYLNGMFVEKSEEKARLYLMMGAFYGCRLSTKTLGNNFLHGKDGFPADINQSFYYYFTAARLSQKDNFVHKETMTNVNNVRLSDEKAMKQQLDEDEDTFQWMKFQASKGIFEAKRNLARMLFWGQQGLKRNLHQAFEYYKEAAEGNDPVALYDYGISLLQGYGTEKNIEAGVAAMEKAAELDNIPALNSLGWYYISHKNDVKTAAEYFERAAKLGNRDAIYNIGHMYHMGTYPDHKKDLCKAYDYYLRSARLGHIESCLHVSMWHATGLRDYLPKNTYYGVLWAKHLSEVSPDLGEFIREALQAVKAATLYIAAAETGYEITGFNAAFMLGEHPEVNETLQLKRDCEWRFWNESAKENFPHPYVLNKMGDYHYYGYGGEINFNKSMVWYAKATARNFTQSMFNLAVMIEKPNTQIPYEVLEILNLKNQTNITNTEVVLDMYRRCISVKGEDTRMPCYLGLIRVQTLSMWNKTELYKKIFVACLIGVLTLLLAFITRCFMHEDIIPTVEQGNLLGPDQPNSGLLQDTTFEDETDHPEPAGSDVNES